MSSEEGRKTRKRGGGLTEDVLASAALVLANACYFAERRGPQFSRAQLMSLGERAQALPAALQGWANLLLLDPIEAFRRILAVFTVLTLLFLCVRSGRLRRGGYLVFLAFMLLVPLALRRALPAEEFLAGGWRATVGQLFLEWPLSSLQSWLAPDRSVLFVAICLGLLLLLAYAAGAIARRAGRGRPIPKGARRLFLSGTFFITISANH